MAVLTERFVDGWERNGGERGRQVRQGRKRGRSGRESVRGNVQGKKGEGDSPLSMSEFIA